MVVLPLPPPSLPLPPPTPSPPPQKKGEKGEEGGEGGRRGRGGSLETGLDRSERIETCFDRFKRVNLNGLKRVSTGSNVFQQV